MFVTLPCRTVANLHPSLSSFHDFVDESFILFSSHIFILLSQSKWFYSCILPNHGEIFSFVFCARINGLRLTYLVPMFSFVVVVCVGIAVDFPPVKLMISRVWRFLQRMISVAWIHNIHYYVWLDYWCRSDFGTPFCHATLPLVFTMNVAVSFSCCFQVFLFHLISFIPALSCTPFCWSNINWSPNPFLFFFVFGVPLFLAPSEGPHIFPLAHFWSPFSTRLCFA